MAKKKKLHKLTIVGVIATPPRLIGDLLAIKSLMFEVVLANNYVLFCKSTNHQSVNKMLCYIQP